MLRGYRVQIFGFLGSDPRVFRAQLLRGYRVQVLGF